MIVFQVGQEERRVSDEEAQWLIEQLMALDDEQDPAVAVRVQRARFSHETVALSREEARRLLQVFERSVRPRTVELRAFEVALYAFTFGEPH